MSNPQDSPKTLGLTTRFKKKPIEVEAVQFTDEAKDRVYRWAVSIQQNVSHSWKDGMPCLVIPTLEGEMICSLGDWLIVEPFPTDWRKLYPCKPDIFESTYVQSYIDAQKAEGTEKKEVVNEAE